MGLFKRKSTSGPSCGGKEGREGRERQDRQGREQTKRMDSLPRAAAASERSQVERRWEQELPFLASMTAHQIFPIPMLFVQCATDALFRGELGWACEYGRNGTVTLQAGLGKEAQPLSGMLLLSHALEAAPSTQPPCCEEVQGSRPEGGPHRDVHLARNGGPPTSSRSVGEGATQ